jgi:hypothetical protein
MSKVYVTGDTHGSLDYNKLELFSNNNCFLTKSDYVIILGDFGFIWDNYESKTEKIWKKWFDNKPWTTLFIDGNHENFDRLKNIPITNMLNGLVGIITDSIFHLKRGEIYIINNKSFFVGNTLASSIATTGDVTAFFSDERLKEKISNVDNALDKVLSLNGFYYKNNNFAKSVGYTDEDLQLGLSAQEIQKVAPEIVKLAPFDMETDKEGNITSKSGENYLTVNYAKLVPILVEAIKDQQKQIEELKSKIG